MTNPAVRMLFSTCFVSGDLFLPISANSFLLFLLLVCVYVCFAVQGSHYLRLIIYYFMSKNVFIVKMTRSISKWVSQVAPW